MDIVLILFLVAALVALLAGVCALAVAEATEIRNPCLMQRGWTVTGRCLMVVCALCIGAAWVLVLA